MSEAALETLLRRDRVVVGAALAVLIVAAWLYLLHLASAMSEVAMPDTQTMPGMAMLRRMPGAGWRSVRSPSCGP